MPQYLKHIRQKDLEYLALKISTSQKGYDLKTPHKGTMVPKRVHDYLEVKYLDYLACKYEYDKQKHHGKIIFLTIGNPIIIHFKKTKAGIQIL